VVVSARSAGAGILMPLVLGCSAVGGVNAGSISIALPPPLVLLLRLGLLAASSSSPESSSVADMLAALGAAERLLVVLEIFLAAIGRFRLVLFGDPGGGGGR